MITINITGRIISLLLALSLTIQVIAQQTNPEDAILSKIRKAENDDSHIEEIGHYLTDVSGGRLPGSEGYKRASAWAVGQMKKWGLANSSLESWGEFGRQWNLQYFSMYMRTPYAQPVTAYPEPWTAATKGEIKGQVILISEKNYADTSYIRKHITEFKSKIILVVPDALPSLANFQPEAVRLSDSSLSAIREQHGLTRKMVEDLIIRSELRKKVDVLIRSSGAIARISSPDRNINGIVHVQANYGFRLTDPVSVPKAVMSYEDGQRIKRLIQSGHSVELSVNIQASSSTADTSGYNVIAEIPGTDSTLKSELVMLGGHLDSWQASTGATDNAAGCIVVMEAMRLIKSLGLKPKRTIRVALWDGEEQGLYGSYNYVKKHFMNAEGLPNEAQKKVSAYFNMDYGTGKIRGIYAQNNTAVKPLFEKWFEPFHDLGANTVTLENTGSTDHLSFDWAGIPGFQFIQDPVDEDRTHHTNLDDYDHLQIADLKQAAIIVASFVYQASNRPDPLPRKPFMKETFLFEGL